MKRKLSASNLHTMYTWVDASYAVHPDMRSHTGRALSLGVGALNVMSRKLRLNSKSSAEAEVVGTSDYVPKNIWFQMFLEEQRYSLKETSCISTISPPFVLKGMVEDHVDRPRGTLTFDIFL